MDREQVDGLHALAATQHGLFTLGQAVASGVSERAVRHAIERGWVRPVRRTVYAVAGLRPSPWEETMAVALAAGPNAVVSHASAAAIHRFQGIVSGRLEVTTLASSRPTLTGVRVHRSRGLEPADVEARRMASPDRRGAVRLPTLLAHRMAESRVDSQLEQRVLRLIKGRVPDPVMHHQVVLDSRVIDMDLAWPEIRLDGEMDGLRGHTQRSDFDRERLRANLLGRNGWRIVRWTSTMDDDVILAQVVPYFDIS